MWVAFYEQAVVGLQTGHGFQSAISGYGEGLAYGEGPFGRI